MSYKAVTGADRLVCLCHSEDLSRSASDSGYSTCEQNHTYVGSTSLYMVEVIFTGCHKTVTVAY